MMPFKYNNLQVALHWLTASVIVFLLITGTFVLADIDNADPGKVNNIRIHMILGFMALILTVARIAWRAKSAQPAHLSTGNAVLDKVGVAAHYVLNLTALVIGVSGVGLALAAGLPDIVFFGQGNLPESFFDFVARYVHGISTKIMLALVALHVLGGVYHAAALKDGIFSRVWFGRSDA